MHRDSPVPPIIFIIIFLLMSLDARILGGIVCIPTGLIMLKQRHCTDQENAGKYDLVALIGGIGMLFFGICIIINYFFI